MDVTTTQIKSKGHEIYAISIKASASKFYLTNNNLSTFKIKVILFPRTNSFGEDLLNADEQFRLKGGAFKDFQHPKKKF